MRTVSLNVVNFSEVSSKPDPIPENRSAGTAYLLIKNPIFAIGRTTYFSVAICRASSLLSQK